VVSIARRPPQRDRARPLGRRVRLLAIVAALAVVGPLVASSPASAQETGNAPPGAKEALEARRDELVAALAGAAEQLDSNRVALRSATEAFEAAEAALPGNLEHQREVAEAQVLPSRARREFALTAYMGGDPRGRQFIESLATGTFTLEPLRDAVIYEVAQARATERLAELTAEAAGLATEQAELEATRDANRAARDAASAEIGRLEVQIAAFELELADVEKTLRRYGANSSGFPLTGLDGAASRPALAVKIDNHPDARPQSGLNQADLVYEELVEGGITRFIAVFHSSDADVVGPIRSGRTSDLDVLANLNKALFASSGGNANVLDALESANLVSVIENYQADAYYRDDSGYAPHNLYSSTDALYAVNPGGAGTPPRLFLYRGVGEPTAIGRPVTGFAVRIGNDTVDYTWNGTGWQRGTASTTDADGVALAPENVVVQFVDYGVSSADERSPEVRITGSGEAWVFTDGRLIEGAWQRDTTADVTFLTDAQGNEIALTPGRTWVLLPEPGRASVFG